jgi:hypothetical protein
MASEKPHVVSFEADAKITDIFFFLNMSFRFIFRLKKKIISQRKG